VKLQTVYGVFFVADGHDFAVGGFGDYFQVLRQGVFNAGE
jgi:hypothetical protein